MALVYRHRRVISGEVFYIGISNSNNERARPYEYGVNRNIFWKRIVKKYGRTVDILIKNIPYEDAKELEILLIEEYGRRNLCKGSLVNLTDGGDGSIGAIRSKETRDKISLFNMGKTMPKETRDKISRTQTGRKLSEETKEKMSLARLGKKYRRKIKIKNIK